MNNCQFTPAALDDLADIWNWIAADYPAAADKLIEDIREACEQIAVHPESGTRRLSWTDKPVRFLLVRKLLFVIYIPDIKPVEIIRVLQAARDIPAILRSKIE
jgi:toxin ParE1/3/4